MKVLAISDSHGKAKWMKAVIEKEALCSHIFFLGDGERDLNSIMPLFPDRKFFFVCGNCDSGNVISNSSYDNYCCIDKTVCLLTHGHLYGAKGGKSGLVKQAQSVLADAVIFGHTHRQFFQKDEMRGIYLINPGALFNGQYAVLNISNKEIDVDFKSVED